MQDQKRSNRERSEGTRAALVAQARTLFVRDGYAATSTPQVAAAAGVSRGALYHQFIDKQDLFRAVLDAEARDVTRAIESTPVGDTPVDALIAGARAYMRAMQVEGRTRLLLIDGPAVLGSAAIRALDEANAERTLADGVAGACPSLSEAEVRTLAALLSATFDRAALAVLAGEDESVATRMAIRVLRGAIDHGSSSDASP